MRPPLGKNINSLKKVPSSKSNTAAEILVSEPIEDSEGLKRELEGGEGPSGRGFGRKVRRNKYFV